MKGKKLTELVLQTIQENWPIHPSGVCRLLKIEVNVSNISKVKYHFDQLKRKSKIHTTKIDRALVAWPVEIDKLRVVHEMMREH